MKTSLFMIMLIWTGFQNFGQVIPGTVIEEVIPAGLATPAAGCIKEIPVIIIRYLPTVDGVNIDVAQATDYWSLGYISLEALKQNIDRYDSRVKFGLEEGSRYHGYKDPGAKPYLGYRVIKYLTVYRQMQPGIFIRDVGSKKGYQADYNKEFADLNLIGFINANQVREVWIWSGEAAQPDWPSYNPAVHSGIPHYVWWPESNMSSPTTGDISNSYRIQDDLPIVGHTYVVYGQNFRRCQAEAIHNHGHQLESIFKYVNERQDGNQTLFLQDFSGWGSNDYSIPPLGRAGDCHHPPNTTQDYDYLNISLVESDIEDWQPSGGAKKPVNVNTWGNLVYNWPGEAEFQQRVETQWYIYWMQNMPGKNNQIPYSEIGGNMTNWWVFTGDWDDAITNNIGLHDFDINGTYLNKPLAAGWNWFSLNVQGPDMSVGKVLGSLNASDSDYIKNQTVSATYYDGIGWFGDLAQIDPREMYKIKLSQAGTLKFNGTAVDIGTHPITVRNGWNWIGYLEQIPRNVTDALASITPVAGDIIKNRTQSSTFNAGAGWSGEVGNLEPLDGYMLKTSHDGTLTFPGEPKSGILNDSRDGKSYPWIRIGQQIWMAENLAWLPSVSPSSSGSNTVTFYYVYNYQGSNTDEAKANPNYNGSGVLYNWIAALTACPPGWKLPTDQEWMTLEKFLGMTPLEASNWGIRTSGSVGRQLKSTAGWNSSGNGDNSSGFTGKPGGEKNFDGYFGNFGNAGNYWSSTDYDEIGAWPRILRHTNDGVARDGYYKSGGFSVRCIKN